MMTNGRSSKHNAGRWRAQVIIAGLIAVCWGPALAALEPPSDHEDLPQAEAVRPVLYATGFEFAEGPAFDRQGNLFVVNYRGNGNIGRITPDGEASIWCNLGEVAPMEERRPQANGLKVDREGRLVVADAGGGRVLRISSDGKTAEVLADRYAGSRFNSINDVALDTRGNIYFTDPGGSSAERPIGSVYRYDIATSKVTQLATGLAFPNGLAVTPDQRRLCVAETERRRILVYRLDEEPGNGRVLVEWPADDSVPENKRPKPDGMTFDEKGRLYVATWTGGTIDVVDIEQGRIIRRYPGGGDRVTNCHFFGTDLYTTVVSKEAVFRLPLGVAGFDYNRP